MSSAFAALLGGLLLWAGDDAPPPTAQEQSIILDKAREIALQYTATLPNFICTETVRRYGGKNGRDDWQPRDTLVIDLAYSEKGERYRLLSIDGKPTTRSFGKVGGFTSNGEFGTLLAWIFRAKSATEFHWDRWSVLRGRPAHVFTYRIPQNHSEYQVNLRGAFFKRYHLVAAFSGLIFVDGETSQVMRITHAAEAIPADFPVAGTPASLDYGFAEIGGRTFLLPLQAELVVLMRDGSRNRNLIEFGNYRKFSSETTLTFEKQ